MSKCKHGYPFDFGCGFCVNEEMYGIDYYDYGDGQYGQKDEREMQECGKENGET